MEWINVKDKMPENRVTVLFCTEDVNTPAMIPLQGFYDSVNKIWMGYLWSQQRTDVTHWMPLPEPPKKQSK